MVQISSKIILVVCILLSGILSGCIENTDTVDVAVVIYTPESIPVSTPEPIPVSTSEPIHCNGTVIIIDATPSTLSEIVVGTGVTFNDYGKNLAQCIIEESDDFVSIITFDFRSLHTSIRRGGGSYGSPGYRDDKMKNVDTWIESLIQANKTLHNNTNRRVIIISDGNINQEESDDIRHVIEQMQCFGVEFQFIHVMSSPNNMQTLFADLATQVNSRYYQTEYPNLYPQIK